MYNAGVVKERLDSQQQLFLIGVSVGLFYGLLIRLGSEIFPNTEAFSVMTLGFLLLLPFAIGFVTIYLVETNKAQTVSVWVFLPWVPVIGGTISTVLVYWEGMICAVLVLPLSFVLASLGGLIAGYIARSKVSRTARSLTLSCVLALPLLVTPWETRVFSQNELRRVSTSIVIHGSPEVVWRNIERVREIRPSELPSSWTRQIGFPAPVEATLSSEGVGGIRHASFTGGVLFVENVNEWVPNSRLAFSIHAQTDQIPRRTLDDHVRVGGRFFDVLSGEYSIEPLSNGFVRLHLSSEHRLSTDFNWYASLWTDAIMKDVQMTILEVIQNRCESGAK